MPIQYVYQQTGTGPYPKRRIKRVYDSDGVLIKHRVCKPIVGRLKVWVSNPFRPHQGLREKARRLKQAESGNP